MYTHQCLNVSWNTAKCQLIKYGEFDDIPFYFNGTLIEYERHGVYLGHSIGPVTHCYNGKICRKIFFNKSERHISEF